MDAVPGQIAQEGVIRFFLEHVTQMPLADTQALCDAPHGDARVVVMCADIIHGLQDIFALISFFQSWGSMDGLFLLHPALEIPHRLFQLPVVEGLQEEVHRPQPQGALGVSEAVIGGEDDDVHRVARLPQAAEHLNAVHPGHLQIGDDEGGGEALHGVQGLLAVGGLPHHDAVQGGPVHRQDNALADELLVLHNQNLQHDDASSL